MSLDKYFGRRYDSRRYNCAHFVCEVWSDLKGDQFAIALHGLLCPVSDRRAIAGELRRIQFLKRAESPCVAYMQSRLKPPHVGVWISGRVLHLTETAGVQYQPIDVASLGFDRVRFLTC